MLPIKYVFPLFLFNQMLAAFLRNDGDPGRATAAVLAGGIFSTYCFQAIMKPRAAFVVSVARGLVISGVLILLLPVLAGAEALWLARHAHHGGAGHGLCGGGHAVVHRGAEGLTPEENHLFPLPALHRRRYRL